LTWGSTDAPLPRSASRPRRNFRQIEAAQAPSPDTGRRGHQLQRPPGRIAKYLAGTAEMHDPQVAVSRGPARLVRGNLRRAVEARVHDSPHLGKGKHAVLVNSQMSIDHESLPPSRLGAPASRLDGQPAARIASADLRLRKEMHVVREKFLQLSLRLVGGAVRLGQPVVVPSKKIESDKPAMLRPSPQARQHPDTGPATSRQRPDPVISRSCR
jgi:hypothetical protein